MRNSFIKEEEKMTNKEIYKKTLVFSIRSLLFDLLAVLLVIVLCTAGFLVMDKINDHGLIGLLIGLVIAIIAAAVFMRFISYTYKAGQIAMMTAAITEGRLPSDVLGEGKKVVKDRFATVALFYAANRVIKRIFSQLSKGVMAIGEAVGGDNGKSIAGVIQSVIEILISYLCDCCLGWVFFRKAVSSAKATCEGAVIFFKHGKTLLKNMGRILGMGIASLVVIGGSFSAVFYLIFSRFPATFEKLTAEVAEIAARSEGEVPGFLSDPKTALLTCAILAGVIIWTVIHSTFIHPFILVGVLRNYLGSGMNDIPAEAEFEELDSKSARFAKLRKEISM